MNITPRTTFKTLLVALATCALIACGGSSSSPDNGGNGPDPEPEVNVNLSFIVQSHDGARLQGADVALGEESADSDADGQVSFTLPASDQVVVTARMTGYITQSVAISAEEDAITPIRLARVKQTLPVDAIEDARVISANDLGARITLPADGFVTPDGEPASGSASIQITPWDISNGELNAMLGNGQALDVLGERAELISAGMITVDIYNDAGEYLQLAPGATAEIQMDLPIASINNQPLSIGSTIPMWHFDEAMGLWVEDEDTLGTVVASATSPVGLAVYAQVSHFSTWNWDFKFENGGSIHVECRMPDNSPEPCAITAEVTLDDGSTFTRSGQLPAGGSTIINMPNSADITWYATSAGGLLGEENTDMSGDVVIALGEPTTSNEVQCVLPDSTPVACVLTMTDGTNTLTQTIPSQGAIVATAWTGVDNTTVLNWSAHIPGPIVYNQQNVLAEGTGESDISEPVVLALTTTPIESVDVTCVGVSGTAFPCDLELTATVPGEPAFIASQNIVADGASVLVPAEAVSIHWSAVSSGAYSQNGQFVELSGSATSGLLASLVLVLDEEVSLGAAPQSVEVRCVNGQDTSATSCDIEVFRESNAGYGSLASFEAVPVDEFRTVEFPNGMSQDNDWVMFNVSGDDDSYAYDFSSYSDLTEGEQIDLELSCGEHIDEGEPCS